MDIISKRRWLFLFASALALISVIALLIPPAIRPGIDFTSGSVLTITFERPVSEQEVRSVLAEFGHAEAVIQRAGENTVIIRTRVLKEAALDAEGNVVRPGEREQIERALEERVAPIKTRDFSSVSPVVARETVRNSVIAALVALVGILLYLAWAFRRVPHPFRYGVSAVVGLAYTVLVVVGVFSILSKAVGLEVNAMFIAGILTVVGYGVNDTVVVFDRIRENVARALGRPIEEVVNESVLQSLTRSLNTSLTTLLVIVAMLLMGGATIRGFLLTLLVGIVVSTYTSLFLASPLIVAWERGEVKNPLRILLPASR